MNEIDVGAPKCAYRPNDESGRAPRRASELGDDATLAPQLWCDDLDADAASAQRLDGIGNEATRGVTLVTRERRREHGDAERPRAVRPPPSRASAPDHVPRAHP